jgi:hypothetical protein
LIPTAKNRAGDGSFALTPDTTLPDIDIKDPTRGIATVGAIRDLDCAMFPPEGRMIGPCRSAWASLSWR